MPSDRDLAVWSAAIGSAQRLPLMSDHPEVAADLTAAQAELVSSSTKGVAAAMRKALAVCVPDPLAHPVRQGEVVAARRNLEAAIEQLTGASVKAEPETADEPDDGKVDCSCGKRHAAGSKVLARHSK